MRKPTLDQMKDDLMKVFREVSGNYECRNNWEAWERVVEHPAPRFYINPRSAHRFIAPMLRGDRSKIEKLPQLNQEMYLALFETTMRLWAKREFWGKSLHYVLQFAVLEQAPRFYIKKARMGQIWREKTKRTKIVNN